MRNTLIVSALCGFAAAAPQMINIGAAEAVPTPTILGPDPEATKPAPISYNPSAAASAVAEIVSEQGAVAKLRKRGDCQPQPTGKAKSPGNGSVGAYMDTDNELRKAAQDAKTPTNYNRTFVDLTGSSQQIGYLTYKNLDGSSYDVQACADFCTNEKFCLGFNIFYERDPSVDPGTGCLNPEPITNLKCSIYGYPVAAEAATNQGQWRNDFQVVIVGSNGYSKNPGPCKGAPTVPNFETPTNLPGAINAPLKDGYDTYNGMRLFNDGPFDPSLCAAACEGQSDYDRNHKDSNGNYKPCNFFTSYILTKNNVPLGTYCALYTDTWDKELAVNKGYNYGDDKYAVICAASYAATTIDEGGRPKANPVQVSQPGRGGKTV